LYPRLFLILLIGFGPFAAAAEEWWTLAGLRSKLPSGSRIVGYWYGPDPKHPAAACAAASVNERTIHAVVRLAEGTEVLYDGSVRVTGSKWERVSSLDLEGAETGEWAVLFHTEPRMARSAVSFETRQNTERVRAIVAGLAPGMWEVWRDGWVIEPEIPVRGPEGVLYFEARPGSYFIRRLN
jgi:hypothetical protein